MRLILASASPARLQILRAAGVEPIVHVSGVDESGVEGADAAAVASALARLKAEAVLDEVGTDSDVVVVGCDSLLELDGVLYGKPGTDEVVRERWRTQRGRTGALVTGHHLVVVRDGAVSRDTRAASTRVTFADVTDAEIEAYIATGEPHHCAGAFTIDGFGGAFVERLEGDHLTVIGLSLPLLRHMLADAGLAWTDLWRR
ncbi:MAG: nucleoside triphosphate pyrophosphatase [Propionibacteriaceae bacterium]|nr:nucleoside triphosphate pyrophosphatase [Propionibacteriaceae bacterium]